MSLVLGLGLATAQQATPTTTPPPPPPKVAHHTKTPAKAATMTPAKEVKPAAPTAVKMKKDGTPDKRYKNSQHLKKDGTPDKRYKANK